MIAASWQAECPCGEIILAERRWDTFCTIFRHGVGEAILRIDDLTAIDSRAFMAGLISVWIDRVHGYEEKLGMIFDPKSLTWTCHICGEERPDAQIDVQSNERLVNFGDGFSITVCENVRYCRDRAACVEAAKTYHFVRKG